MPCPTITRSRHILIDIRRLVKLALWTCVTKAELRSVRGNQQTHRETSSVAAGFGRHGMSPPASNLDFDRLTLKMVCCESHLRPTGNFSSKFGHARHLGSGIIRYIRDGRTDGRRDKSNAYCLLPTVGGKISLVLCRLHNLLQQSWPQFTVIYKLLIVINQNSTKQL